MKADELRQKSISELNQELLALLREQFNLRVQQATTGKVSQPHLFPQVRHNIARVKTVLNEKSG